MNRASRKRQPKPFERELPRAMSEDNPPFRGNLAGAALGRRE